MSQLKVNTIQGNTSSTVFINSPSSLYMPGSVVQVRYKVSMDRVYYRVQNNDRRPGPENNIIRPTQTQATLLEPLEIVVQPKSINSWFYIEYNIFCEASWDNTMGVARNNNSISGGQALQQIPEAGLYDTWLNSNGVAVLHYDNNTDSTPINVVFGWWDRPQTLNPVTYTPWVKNANNRDDGFVLNATWSNYQNGGDSYEQGVSFGLVEEWAYPQA
jgi:hypothetical protein